MIDVIKRPVITEKAMKLNSKGQYVFQVDPGANKISIRKAIEDLFEVNIVSIRTLRVKGKMKSRMTKKGMMRGKTPLKKKAYITLKAGQTIDIVTGAPSA